jgi:hypothetical protein
MLVDSANVGRWWEEMRVCVHLEQRPGAEESPLCTVFNFFTFFGPVNIPGNH